MSRSSRALRWAGFKPDLPIISGLEPFAQSVDAYRNLALEIESRTGASSRRGAIVAVTGPDAAAGKTLTSLNTAIALAKKGERRVVLLELDIWSPSLSTFLIAQTEIASLGLADYLGGKGPQSLEDVQISIWDAGIDIVPAGETDLSAEAFTSDRMLELIVQLRSKYQFIVFDCPPFEFSTSRWIANRSDCILAIVEAGRTKKRAVEAMLTDIGPNKVVGIVLNKMRRKGLDYSGYGYSSYSYDSGSSYGRGGSQ